MTDACSKSNKTFSYLSEDDNEDYSYYNNKLDNSQFPTTQQLIGRFYDYFIECEIGVK